MGYSPIKMVILGQKLKMQKGAKNDSTTTTELLYAQKPLRKSPITRKMTAF